MKHIFILGLTLLTILSSSSEAADNLIFFDQQPLVRISQKGEISSFSLVDDDSGAIDKNLIKQIRSVWRYPDDGKAELTQASIKNGFVGCDVGFVVKTTYDDQGLLTTKPLTITNSNAAVVSDEKTLRQARALLSKTLRMKKLAAQWKWVLDDRDALVPYLIRYGAESIVITVHAERNDRTLSVFLIADKDSRGNYRISMETVSEGGANDSESYAGAYELVMYGDMNNDMIPELVVRRTAYESFDIELLQRTGSTWEVVASTGGGC